jgi:hypothetical protein
LALGVNEGPETGGQGESFSHLIILGERSCKEKDRNMTESGSKAKEIALGDELGDIAVKANGVRVEIHTDGSVVAYTTGDVDAYTSGAVHVHPALNDDAKVTAKAEPKPGDRMADGTVYAGISPDTGKAMYATPKDAPLTMKWKAAMEYAAKLDAHGHKDWHAPTKGELNVLYNNRATIGGFDESGSIPAGWYWSSLPSYYGFVWDQRFSDGFQGNGSNNVVSSLRCVR